MIVVNKSHHDVFTQFEENTKYTNKIFDGIDAVIKLFLNISGSIIGFIVVLILSAILVIPFFAFCLVLMIFAWAVLKFLGYLIRKAIADVENLNPKVEEEVKKIHAVYLQLISTNLADIPKDKRFWMFNPVYKQVATVKSLIENNEKKLREKLFHKYPNLASPEQIVEHEKSIANFADDWDDDDMDVYDIQYHTKK